MRPDLKCTPTYSFTPLSLCHLSRAALRTSRLSSSLFPTFVRGQCQSLSLSLVFGVTMSEREGGGERAQIGNSPPDAAFLLSLSPFPLSGASFRAPGKERQRENGTGSPPPPRRRSRSRFGLRRQIRPPLQTYELLASVTLLFRLYSKEPGRHESQRATFGPRNRKNRPFAKESLKGGKRVLSLFYHLHLLWRHLSSFVRL